MEPLNPKIIAIVLRNYFCNISHLTEEEILKYYFTLRFLVNKDEDITWEEIGADYIIWEPFENTNPSDVIDNMEALYFDIISTLNLSSPNIVINPLEVSSNLAEDYVVEYFTQELQEDYQYTTDDGVTLFTEDAQEIFNDLYCHISGILYGNKL